MKKFTWFIVLVLVTCFELQAQHLEGNPFSRLGYKADVYTFGEKKEFHDQEDVVEIGDVLFNTRTNEVIGYVEEDTDSLIELKPELQSMSIDPLCEKYYSISPYAYCMNNPVNCIDPDGRDWYRHNENGSYYWQEGHDELDGYTNIGSSVSIQLGEDSYFNAYQNAGVMANQAVDAFGLISSSAKLQNQFLGKNSPLSESSKSELFNALVNRESNEIGRPIGETVVSLLAGEAVGVIGGRILSWGISKMAGKVTVQFGNTANQAYHAYRHIDELGLDRNVVTQMIRNDFLKKYTQVIPGKPFNSIVEIAGNKLQYTAFKLPDGRFNIGRIHSVK